MSQTNATTPVAAYATSVLKAGSRKCGTSVQKTTVAAYASHVMRSIAAFELFSWYKYSTDSVPVHMLHQLSTRCELNTRCCSTKHTEARAKSVLEGLSFNEGCGATRTGACQYHEGYGATRTERISVPRRLWCYAYRGHQYHESYDATRSGARVLP
eukprot:3058157-Rhodomonas_salina.1